jgi:short-subunit dehydrogenase
MVIPAYAGALNAKSKRETALITGASAGIGLDLARLMAPDHDLILVARSQGKLEALGKELEAQHGSHVHVLPADLSRPESPGEIFMEIARRGLQVDVLINNAGFGVYGYFSKTSLPDELHMVQVNITALTHLTKLALPGMLERKHGRIMHVASTAGFQPGPLMSVYYATKAYVLSFSEAIANELNGSGVTVTCLCPGPTETEFASRAKLEKTRLFKLGAMTSHDVARIGLAGMLRGRTLIVPGVKNKLLAQSVRFSPRKVVTAIARMIQESVE